MKARIMENVDCVNAKKIFCLNSATMETETKIVCKRFHCRCKETCKWFKEK